MVKNKSPFIGLFFTLIAGLCHYQISATSFLSSLGRDVFGDRSCRSQVFLEYCSSSFGLRSALTFPSGLSVASSLPIDEDGILAFRRTSCSSNLQISSVVFAPKTVSLYIYDSVYFCICSFHLNPVYFMLSQTKREINNLHSIRNSK